MYKILIKSRTHRDITVCALLQLYDCPTGYPYVYTFWKCWHESERQMAGGRQSHIDGKTGRRDRQQKNVLAGWHEYTSFLYGLDQADECWGSRLRRCELLAQVRHRNSWNNNTNHCYTSGTKPLKGHGGAAALTRAQLTGSSWRYTACIMLWVYIKSTRNVIKYDKVDFSVHLAKSTPVLAKEPHRSESISHLIHR